MFVFFIVAAVLAVLCGFMFFKGDEYGDYSDGWGAGCVVLIIIAGLALVMSINLRLSNQNLTGYIYSSSTTVGYTTAHIRFSENAGADAQPEFCVKAESDAGRAIKQYVGSGKKVQVDIPSYFYFANNPFACGTTDMTIKEVK